MTIRYRKNINCLSSDELHDLREAYQALYDLPEGSPDSFATLGGIHGLPNPPWCDHGTPGFLTWHRAYMLAFERALQAHGCHTKLPFWNWSSGPTTGVPAACRDATYVNRAGNTVPNPLYSGPISSAAGGGTTSRRPDIDTTTFGDLATSAQAAMSASTFGSFQNSLNGPHGGVHGRTGGQMSSVARAGFDPIFYLHHCNVDRLWWNWQQSHPGALLPAGEAVHPLDPFPQPFDDAWLTGSDVVDTDHWGYRYLNWCFFIPPIVIWKLIPIELPIPLATQVRDARLVVRAAHMPAESIELRVFVGDEDQVRDDAIENNPSFAGTVGVFGMGAMEPDEGTEHGTFDVALNLTEHVRRACGSSGHGHDHDDDQNGGDEHDAGRDDKSHHGDEHEPDDREQRPAHDEPTRKVALRVAAFDANGNRLDPKRLPVDDIELLVD